MARVRGPGKFKQMVEERFLTDLPLDERRKRLAPVFFATADPDNLTPTPKREDWNRGLDNIEAFLVHFARHFTDADVYNSLKHGLAVRPGDAATQLDDGALLKAEGQAIEYLSIRRNSGDRPRWNRTITWIRPDQSMGLVHVAASLMKSLWTIAKLRYLNERFEWLNLWTAPVYGDLVRPLPEGEEAGIIIDSVHMELAYYIDPEAEEPPQTEAA